MYAMLLLKHNYRQPELSETQDQVWSLKVAPIQNRANNKNDLPSKKNSLCGWVIRFHFRDVRF